ncbi:MAG: transcription elongation factor GreA [Anaerolineae bacterium]|nr:transcription elongation factor GreA [Anaerolineae bacterium]
MTDDIQYLTLEGLQELEEKLNFLRTVRRQEIALRLHQAMEEGGELAENAEYEDAKNDQAFVEGEIIRLETILRNARVIQEDGRKDIVGLGDKVTVREKGRKETEIYLLVGAAEANPQVGKISYKSPLGQALMNKKVGDKVKVNAPDGEIVFEVVAID